MSCGSCQQPYNFNTDHAGTASCNRNNCRCGNEEACMYYNRSDGRAGHYNYTAVQGAGDPDDPRYGCSSKAYDYYNATEMYGDHALGGLGTYAQAYGEANQEGLYGHVKYNDSKCSEHKYGQRDMCDGCGSDHPDFSRGAEMSNGDGGELPFGIPDYLDGDANFEMGMHANGLGFDFNMQRWLLLVVVVTLLWYMKGSRQLPSGITRTLSTRFMGFSVMNGLVAVAVVYAAAFFF